MTTLRRMPSVAEAAVWGGFCILVVFAVWSLATSPTEPVEERFLAQIPSPAETFDRDKLEYLWDAQKLPKNTWASLRRVTLGFGLAAVVGVPLGVLCGCFSWARAFFAPLSLFGRYIPIAALIPLTFAVFGIGETQKVMFIFLASVAFVLADTARAIGDLGSQYIDTALTLGASRRQVILKVLVPLAMPDVFNSLRLLFGLAFGYIMLAETIKLGGESGGLGDIIIMSQRLGHRESIYLVLLIIPLVAFGIDRVLYVAQRELFPYRYGGRGILHDVVRGGMYSWEDLKTLVFKPVPPPQGITEARKEPTPPPDRPDTEARP